MPSKNEKLWYASLPRSTTQSRSLRVTSTSDMTLSVCASLRGLCASVSTFQKSPHTYGLQITLDIRKPQSFCGCCLTVHLSILHTFSAFAFVSLKVLPFKSLQVSRCSCKCKSGLSKMRRDARWMSLTLHDFVKQSLRCGICKA